MLLALVMSVCGSQLHIIHTGNNLLDSILGLFVGICGEYCESYFPLLNWFIFIVFGYGLGYTLRRCKDLKRFFAMAVPVRSIAPAVIKTSFFRVILLRFSNHRTHKNR
jgi:uncharacterized membrane protein